MLAAGLLVCVVLQVFYRYVLEDSLVWSDELARFCFVWSSLLAASVVVGRGDHFTIPILVDLLPARLRAATERLCLLLFIAFTVIIIVYGAQWSWRMRNAVSPVLQVPQGLVYAILPLAAFHMLLHLIARLRGLLGRRVKVG
jgi:TRAP-type C4-dicarboxylate transport system permease small subunit